MRPRTFSKMAQEMELVAWPQSAGHEGHGLFFCNPSHSLPASLQCLCFFPLFLWSLPISGLPWWLSGKASACNAGDLGDMGSIPGLGRSPGGGNATCSSILASEIPRTEEPGGLQPMGSQRVGHYWATNNLNVCVSGCILRWRTPNLRESAIKWKFLMIIMLWDFFL